LFSKKGLHQEVIVQLDRLNKLPLKDAKSPGKTEQPDAQLQNQLNQTSNAPTTDKKYQRALTFDSSSAAKT
jgi:hypothetical protein